MEQHEHPAESQAASDCLHIAGRRFQSRFFVGTGKFSSPEVLREAVEHSGAELITVALRRVNLRSGGDPTLRVLNPQRHLIVPNTSGARDASEALRLARLGREVVGHSWVKLEVTPDPATLLPDPVETLKAAEQLVREGFVVLPYINADPILAKRLEEVGCAAVMPLGAPIGSNRGLKTRDQVRIIIEQATVPAVVDAGLGLPSHACEAMEIGADAVLVNTALATAGNPPLMAAAFAQAVEAGRRAYLAGVGRVLGDTEAEASSPLTGFLTQ